MYKKTLKPRPGAAEGLPVAVQGYADMLVGARHAVPLQVDHEKAKALLEEALAISTRLGMRPLTLAR